MRRFIELLVFLAFPLAAAGQVPEVSSTQTFVLPETTQTDHVDYQADTFDYVKGSTTAQEAIASVIHLQGHVWVKDSTWTLRAGELWLDLDSRQGHAEGGFTADDNKSLLSGSRGDFDFEDHTGQVTDAMGDYPPWRIWSRWASFDEKHKAHFRRAYFTSCSYYPPHYHFWAYRLHVKPQGWLYAWNVFFFMGRVPLFYTPFLYKSLDPKPWLHTRVVPGYDKTHGGTLRTTTLFSISESMYGKFYLDHYGKERPGYGGELLYRGGRGNRGSLYGYRILERTGRDRWTAVGDLYQTMSSSFAVQGRLQAQSDTNFNNDYQRSNSFRVTDQLVNSGALVYHAPKVTAHLSYSRLDIQDPNGLALPLDDPRRSRYVRQTETPLGFDFTSAQMSWKRLPFLYTLSGNAKETHDLGVPYTERTSALTLQATQRYLLGRGLSFTPLASISDTYENVHSAPTSSVGLTPPITDNDAFTPRYQAGGNLRLPTPLGTWDLTETYVRRFKPGTLRVDVGAPDYGVESNSLALQETLRPNRLTLLRVGSSYNFQVFRDQTLDFHQRFTPFIGDLVVTPGGQVQLTLRDVYNLGFGNQNFVMQADWGDRLGTFVGLGVFQTLSRMPVDRSQQYIASTDFGLGSSSSTWRILGTMRYVANVPAGLASANTLAVFEKELSITRRFHDFTTRIIMRERPVNVKEFLFRFEMRIGQKTGEEHIVRKEWENEWYPWRRSGVEDR